MRVHLAKVRFTSKWNRNIRNSEAASCDAKLLFEQMNSTGAS